MYLYPKFSKIEIPGLRFGGPGLGNLLFIWAAAKAYSIENKMEMIWPTWRSIKIGPWLRNEKDKRVYADLFKNKSLYLDGLAKYKTLLLAKNIYIDEYEKSVNEDAKVLLFDRYEMSFSKLNPYQKEISEMIISNAGSKGVYANQYEPKNFVGIHIRRGDFAKDKTALDEGKTNKQIPIEWYVCVIQQIRKTLGNKILFKVFSDGTDKELQPVLDIPGVERITFGNSIADIIALSKFPLLIVSGSSFSMWARFLGKCSAIGYRNQLREYKLCSKNGFETEIGMDEVLSKTNIDKIEKMYS